MPNRLIGSLREDKITHTVSVPALLEALYLEVLDELVDAGAVATERRHQTVTETARRLTEHFSHSELTHLRERMRECIGPDFRTLFLGGAAVNPAWRKIGEALGIQTEIGYGLTEASPVVAIGRMSECPEGSVGSPLPSVEVRIDDHGEILVRGPSVMRGYHRDAATTALALQDGWLHTGDFGRFASDKRGPHQGGHGDSGR